MDINIQSKKDLYEIGDLIEMEDHSFRMIVKVSKYYALMNMNGKISTCNYNSIKDLLKGREIINHYKNNDLRKTLEEKEIIINNENDDTEITLENEETINNENDDVEEILEEREIIINNENDDTEITLENKETINNEDDDIGNKENYNMLISRMILAKKESFKYDEILKEVQEQLGDDPEIEIILNNCLLRMMNDNYLKLFGTTYTIEPNSLVEGSDRLDLNLSIDELDSRIRQLNEERKEIDKEIKLITEELAARGEDIIPKLIEEINEKISSIQKLGFAITNYNCELLYLKNKIKT